MDATGDRDGERVPSRNVGSAVDVVDNPLSFVIT